MPSHQDHAVTAWHLLFPTSQTRTAIGPPHDWLSCCQEQYGVSTFRLSEFVGLGAGSRPGSQLATRSHSGNDAPASTTFWSRVETTFACFYSRSLSPMTRHGMVRYELKIPYSDGTTHVLFEPLDFIAKLVALVPKPRVNLTRFHGVFAPHSKYRARVTPSRAGQG